MPKRPPTHRPPRQHAPEPEHRPTARQRGYTSRWERARAAYLADHPYCRQCWEDGVVARATVVDHVTPHRGDERLFWDEAGNWQSLCAACHNRKTGAGQ